MPFSQFPSVYQYIEIAGFFVAFEKIKQANYSLTVSRYKEIKIVEREYEKPSAIIDKLLKIEEEIAEDLRNLKAKL